MDNINDIQEILPELLDNPDKYAKSIPIDTLVDILKKLSYYYYQTGNELVPDAIYDLLFDILSNRDPTNLYLQQIGSIPVKDKVKLPYPMASLNKVKPTSDTLDTWKSKYSGPYVISDKLDGVSALLYKMNNKNIKLYTRGDALSGQDISYLIPHIISLKVDLTKIPDKTAIRGELIISKNNFKKISQEYKNARNTVAGLVNSKNYSVEIAKLTNFIAYSIIHPNYKQDKQMDKLKEWNFPHVTYKVEQDITVENLSKYLLERREKSTYDIDGLVVVDSSQIYTVTTSNPNYAFAFKMILTDQIATATVLQVEWNVSKDGYLKPTVKIYPVNLVGVVIKNVTAFNARYVVDNKLGPGAIIKIIRSGDVIPHILEVLKPAQTPQMPPDYIKYKWNKTNIDLIVEDVGDSSVGNVIAIKQITNFFNQLGVKYISEGIVTKLVENKYKTIFDILDGDLNKMSQIEGLGIKVLTKVFDNLKNALQTTNMETLMSASNIFGRGLGKRKLKVILEAYPNIMTNKWDTKTLKNKILELYGFDEITASQFVINFPKFKEFFTKFKNTKFIKDNNINLSKFEKPKEKNKEKKENKNQLFTNQKFVFTGFRDKELQKFIEDNGGTVNTSVSKNTTWVIYTDTSGAKYQTAITLGINTITLDEFREKYMKTK